MIMKFLNIYFKKAFITQGGYYSIIGRFFALVLLLLFTSKALLADDRGKVVIINSDMSIYKYSLAHTEFKLKLGSVAGEIDLGSKWKEETKVKQDIRKIDPDLIYCIGSKAYMLVHKLLKDRNIIFSSAINWHRLPLGKNTYGISNELPQGMYLTMYRYFFPHINKIGVIYSKAYNKEWLNVAKKAAKEMGIEIIGKSVRKHEDIESALNELLPEIDALWLTPDPIVLQNVLSVRRIFKYCENMSKPVFAYEKAFANIGATLVMSADIPTIGRQAAGMALDILANKKITERVQNPAGTHIIINMKKIEEYGLNLNTDALDSVNEIIR